jgi:GSH-dependent disulfide-bond oxidoreductase
MFDVFFWPTGNGKKVTIMMEECGFEYRIIPINIGKGDQHAPEYMKINPNGKMPAMIDRDAEGGPLPIFESGAILIYLAEKAGKLLPTDTRERMNVLQWLFWQVGGLGPMAGQAHFYLHYSDVKHEEGMRRFGNEVARLYRVLDRQLAGNEYVAGNYSIADIATWPWVFRHEWQRQNLDDYPHIKRWFAAVGERPAVQTGAAVGKDLFARSAQMSSEEKALLFRLESQDP